MPYETEAIISGPAVPAAAAPPQMREERVLDPYRARHPRPPTALAPPAASPPIPTRREHLDTPESETEEPGRSVETATLSPAAAALARKEQRFRQQQQELKAQQTALEAERAEIAELRAMKQGIAQKDYSVLEKIVPYDDYTNFLIERDAGASPEQQRVAKLEADMEAFKKAQQDDVSKRFDAAVSERRNAVTQLVQASPEFSAIKELGAEEAVLQHILDTWENDSVDLTVEQAAKEVEELLLEKAKRWTSLSKLKPEQPATTTVEKTQLPPLKPTVKTLTNNMAATGEPQKRPVKSFQGMSDTERYAEARRRAEEKMRPRG